MRIIAGEQDAERVRKTGGDHYFQPRIKSTDERCQRASSRTAGSTHSCRIHVRTADQVIDRAFRIPNEIARDRLTRERGLSPRLNVLRSGPSTERSLQLRIVTLLAFPLADRIKGERDESFQRKIRRQPLRLGFAFLSMSGLQKHRGIAARLTGTVQVGRNIETRQTLVNYFLDDVTVRLNVPGDSGVQWTVVRGQ